MQSSDVMSKQRISHFQLEDHRTLTDYKIQKGFCIIQVLYRALGGINFCVISEDLLDPLYNYDLQI